jgi:hypothetical protein
MILVAAYAVDEYCGGVETLDVLNCVASALDGFNFLQRRLRRGRGALRAAEGMQPHPQER